MRPDPRCHFALSNLVNMDSPQPKHAESTEIDLNPGIKFRKPINVELFKKELSEKESSVERPSKKGPCHEAEIFCYRRKPPGMSLGIHI